MDKISVFGAGFAGEKCFYNLQNQGYEIGYIFDNRVCGKKFHDILILKPSEELARKYKIVVAVESFNVFLEIKSQLNGYGLVEFEDFFYNESFFKKVVVFNANCYYLSIRTMLMSSQDFLMNYMIYPVPPICDNTEGEIDDQALRNASVYIHQDILSSNQFGYKLSDEYIYTKLNKNAVDICIPNLVGLGRIYFPQCLNQNENNMAYPQVPYGLFFNKDYILEDLIVQGKSDEEILYIMQNEEIFKAEEILDNYEKLVMQYKKREEKWDIKILDKMLRDMKTEKVFYDLYHPKGKYLKMIADDILKMLSINQCVEETAELDVAEYPIYGCVRRALGIDYKDELIRKSRNAAKLTASMTLLEFVRQYRYWCFRHS